MAAHPRPLHVAPFLSCWCPLLDAACDRAALLFAWQTCSESWFLICKIALLTAPPPPPVNLPPCLPATVKLGVCVPNACRLLSWNTRFLTARAFVAWGDGAVILWRPWLVSNSFCFFWQAPNFIMPPKFDPSACSYGMFLL